MGASVGIRIELRTSYFDIMINCQMSQKLKLLGNGVFNHLTIILTISILHFNFWLKYNALCCISRHSLHHIHSSCRNILILVELSKTTKIKSHNTRNPKYIKVSGHDEYLITNTYAQGKGKSVRHKYQKI